MEETELTMEEKREKQKEEMMKGLLSYLKHMLAVLPTPYSSQDPNRVTLIYFVLSSLELLGKLDLVDKNQVIDFIYSQQVLPDKNDPNKNIGLCGFRGGPFLGNNFNPNCEERECLPHDHSHLAMTYTALAILKICGDENNNPTPENPTVFSKVNKKAILDSIRFLQGKDGSFSPTIGEHESDMRFVYCAAAISYMLGDFSAIDIDKSVEYIKSAISYDYGIGQGPGQESHGGSTYCAVAALFLMNRLDDLPNKEGLIGWLISKQISGFQGRLNKPADSCYSFWIGGTLAILERFHLVEFDLLTSFVETCFKYGGFGKEPGVFPDVLHTHMSLAGLSLGGHKGIKKVFPALGFSEEVARKFPNPFELN